jgi:uncharacterized protein YjiS (DUF1127 family)
MDSDRRAILIAGPSASLDRGRLRAVPSLTTRWMAAAFINTDRARTQPLFWGTRFLLWCVWCSDRSRQRVALSKLDDRLLKDIGVTRQQADAEAAKPFWK